MPKREFIKLNCQAVLIEKDDDGEVIGELTSDIKSCYNLGQVGELFVLSRAEVEEFNAAQPNRRQRRTKSQ